MAITINGSGITSSEILDGTLTEADWGGNQLSHRNLIINGAMQVAQRGTSSTFGIGYSFVLDRWQGYGYGSNSLTLSQQSFTVGQTDVPNFTKYLRATSTSGKIFLQQKVEDIERVVGEHTLSFYAKSSDITSANALQMQPVQRFGSGGSTASWGTQYYFTLTSSWQRFTLTFTPDSISGKTVGSGSSYDIVFSTNDGTSDYTGTVDITGVQLEVGSVATPFEHRSYGEELERCQRYYYRVYGPNSNPRVRLGVGGWGNATSGHIIVHLPTTMRAVPSLTVVSAAQALLENVAWYTITANLMADATPSMADVIFNVASSASSNGKVAFIGNGGGTELDYRFDSEL